MACLVLAVAVGEGACGSSSGREGPVGAKGGDKGAGGGNTGDGGHGPALGGHGETGGARSDVGGGGAGPRPGGATGEQGGGQAAGSDQRAGGAGAGGLAGATGLAGGGGNPDGARPSRLGMNDVTILAPLPRTLDTPVLLRGTDLADDGTAFVPRALFDRLVSEPSGGSPPLQVDSHTRLQLVAVRFDLCERASPGPCRPTEDAQMRLVFQPISAGPRADDVGFHAFYAIRNEEMVSAVAALHDLAESASGVPGQRGALQISPALSGGQPEAYAAALRSFVRRYGGTGRLIRLTVNMQPQTAAQVRWTLRGVEKKGDTFVDMTIAGTTATTETVILGGSDSSPTYTVNPAADLPAGLAGALSSQSFGTADLATKRSYLTALVRADNPLTETASSVPCAACHVSTIVMKKRADNSGIDPSDLTGRFTSTFDLSVGAGKSAETSFTIRALGYFSTAPLISQRVVNETAETLAEVRERHLDERD